MTAHRRTALHVRPITFLAAAVLLAAVSWVGHLVASRDAGSVGPTQAGSAVSDPGNAIGGVAAPVELSTLNDQIALWSRKAAENVNDYISATNVGVLYLQRAKLTADLADYDRASQAVARAIAADPGYTPARSLDAVVRFATHDFAGALTAAERLLVDEPGQVDALTVQADANLELGHLDLARQGYQRLSTMAPAPSLDARLARFAYLTGDPARAIDLARQARDGSVQLDVADPAFFQFQLGEIARLTGDPATAREAYSAALAIRPSDRASIVGLARLDAADGRPADAIERLRAAIAIAPEPATVALLGDLLAAQGDVTGADQQFDTVRFTARLGSLAGTLYDRQLLLFELDHGGASADTLRRAEAALATRADAAGHDVVAWALHRLGRADEAWAQIAEARGTGIVDARILYHAGAIAIARGDREGARALLEQALALGAAIDPLERSDAQGLLNAL
ncbi:MAG TPA: tetratricopeptide repeat protein [Candidatus Limnocylindrales bacterium]|jgi:tetratricopeptide (TPR) repeat protein